MHSLNSRLELVLLCSPSFNKTKRKLFALHINAAVDCVCRWNIQSKVIINSDTKIAEKHNSRFLFETSLIAIVLDKLPQATQMFLKLKQIRIFLRTRQRANRNQDVLRESLGCLMSFCCGYLPRCSAQLYRTCIAHTCKQHKNLWMFYRKLCKVQMLTHLSSSETSWERCFSVVKPQKRLKGNELCTVLHTSSVTL